MLLALYIRSIYNLKFITHKVRYIFSAILTIGLMTIGSLNTSYGQRYAIIDTRYILNKMPEYADADVQLKK